MDIRKQAEKLPGILKKYKYAVLVLAIGLVLMALPSKKTEQNLGEQQSSAEMKTADPAGELEKILAQIHGVGRVQVLLTVKAGERTVYQTDEDITTSENNSTVRKETVIITDSLSAMNHRWCCRCCRRNIWVRSSCARGRRMSRCGWQLWKLFATQPGWGRTKLLC